MCVAVIWLRRLTGREIWIQLLSVIDSLCLLLREMVRNRSWACFFNLVALFPPNYRDTPSWMLLTSNKSVFLFFFCPSNTLAGPRSSSSRVISHVLTPHLLSSFTGVFSVSLRCLLFPRLRAFWGRVLAIHSKPALWLILEWSSARGHQFRF